MNYFQHSVNPRTALSAPAIEAAPGMSDIVRFIADGLIGPLVQGLSQTAANFSDTMGGLAARRMRADRPRAPKYECDCCEADACHCVCCIVDADVVIYAYLTERRVLPLVIENDRRREKDIKLVLEPFRTRAGKPASISGVLVPPTEFKLGPCAAHAAVVVIDTAPSRQPNTEPGSVITPDVEECTVYYADLRVEGCEIRPLRIAVAIVPRDCGAYKIHCRCCC